MDLTTFGKDYDIVSDLIQELEEVEEKKKLGFIARVLNEFNNDFKALVKSNLIERVKKKFLLSLVSNFRERILNGKNNLAERERRIVYYFVITKWRRWKDEVKK